MIDLVLWCVVLYCVCVCVGGGGGGANLEQEAFQYFSGAELNKKWHSLPPHTKEELQFGSILFHINLQSLHNLHQQADRPTHKADRPTHKADRPKHKADRPTYMHTQGRPTDIHAHTRQTDRHTCTHNRVGTSGKIVWKLSGVLNVFEILSGNLMKILYNPVFY